MIKDPRECKFLVRTYAGCKICWISENDVELCCRKLPKVPNERMFKEA